MRKLTKPLGAALAAVLAAWACDASTGPAPESANRLVVVGGDGQSAVAGHELAEPLTVQLMDAAGRPLAGRPVTFRVISGGGSVWAGSGLTNPHGIARERWTLGTSTADTQRVEVSAGTAAPAAAVLRAAVLADAAAAAAALDGAPRAGAAGEVLADSPGVLVRDRYGNPAPGVAVRWQVTAGGGSATPAESRTDVHGVAWTAWRLGPEVGEQSLAADAGAGTPIVFAATAGPPTGVVVEKLSGDGESATILDSVRVEARVLTAGGAPLANAGVRWRLLPPADRWVDIPGRVAPASSRTDGEGRTTAMVTLGNASGDWQAEVLTDDSASATFTLHAAAGAPHSVAVNAPSEAMALSTITVRLLVLDRYGNPVSGIFLGFAVTQGGGSLNGTRAGTNAAGRAEVLWTLGPAWGTNRLRVDVPGMDSVMVTATGYTSRALVLSDGLTTVSDTVTPTVQCLERNTASATPFVVTFTSDGVPVSTPDPVTLVCPGSRTVPLVIPGLTRGSHTLGATARSDSGAVLTDTSSFRRMIRVSLQILSPLPGDTVGSTFRLRAHCEANAPCRWQIMEDRLYQMVNVSGVTDLDATFRTGLYPHAITIDVWDGYGRGYGYFVILPVPGDTVAVVQ